MNILIPHNWLLEHLDTTASPDQIRELLSLSGPSVERIYEKEGEPVYDIEITANRVDCMSVRGIAREAAVILTYAGMPSKLKPLPKYDFKPESDLPLPTITDHLNLSKRICALILDNTSPTPTPDWMAKRLRQIDQNIHHSLIDITNYVTHELGHPCHAFDYDKIMNLGGQINITKAKPDLSFTTLDNQTYQTQGGEIIFSNNQEQIIDLPAIKGTLNTAVDDNTRKVLLWIESLPAEDIRQTSMTHNIRTVAAQLNEKNVDPELAMPTLLYATNLYRDLTHATIASDIVDIYPHPPTPSSFNLDLATIKNYLGISIPADQITQILTDLECQVKLDNNHLSITPPSFRPDLTMAADIVEEIARIYGYHKLPSKIMSGPIPTSPQKEVNFELEFKIKNYLAASNWQEVYTYSLVSEQIDNQKQNFGITNPSLKLANPLTEDRLYLRQTLIPSLQEVFQNNLIDQLQIFEIANVYHPQPNQPPREELHLTLVSNYDYRQFRTQIEHLLNSLFITNIQVTQTNLNSPALISTLVQNQPHTLGQIYALPKGLFALDLVFKSLSQATQTHPQYQPPHPYPPIIQDFTFEFNSPVMVGQIITQIKSHDLVSSVDYQGSYQNRHTFRVYFQSSMNLTDNDIQPIRTQLIQSICQEFNSNIV